MKSTILVKAVRTFEGDEGWKHPGSEPFAVERQRFADLKANGLVEEVAGSDGDAADKTAPEQKSAPTPENKMAADSKNKKSPEVSIKDAR
jgi:hypothetical protein